VPRKTNIASFLQTGSALASLPNLNRGPELIRSTQRLVTEDPASGSTP
jgi:hypothetical protein